MAHIVVLGAGLGGTIMAYEMKEKLRPEDTITVITKEPKYHFVPSNPWVAVNWRKREDVEVDLAPVFEKKGIGFRPSPATKVDPANNAITLEDGSTVTYDYLIIATGPELAFDEIEGLGPHGGFTQSVCHVDHAQKAGQAFEEFCKNPAPIIVGAVQGASCFGPAYEFLFILETELRRRKIRDRVPMTFVTAEPYIGHLGLDGVGDTKGLLEGEMRGLEGPRQARGGLPQQDGLENELPVIEGRLACQRSEASRKPGLADVDVARLAQADGSEIAAPVKPRRLAGQRCNAAQVVDRLGVAHLDHAHGALRQLRFEGQHAARLDRRVGLARRLEEPRQQLHIGLADGDGLGIGAKVIVTLR